MTYENLSIERNGPVAVVTFARPEKANALNRYIMRDIEAMTDEFLHDTDTRVVVMTGEGKHFSSGADLTAPPVNPPEQTALARLRGAHIGQRMISKLHKMNQITIAAWKGAAMGGGACIVTALDFRIGADDCFMSYPEINLGLSLGWYGLPLCVRIVGPSRAKRLAILGHKEYAPTLLDWGMLDEMVPQDKLMERALELAGQYAAQPPIAAQMIKRSVNAISSTMDEAIMHMDIEQIMVTASTKDSQEAMKAHFEKRQGQYRGD